MEACARLLGDDTELQLNHNTPSASGSLSVTAALPGAEVSALSSKLGPLQDVACPSPSNAVADINDDGPRRHRSDGCQSSKSGRKTRKSELVELREHVKELGDQLSELQTQKLIAEHARDDSEKDPMHPVGATDAASSPAALWERTARAQRDECVRAEVENARLRDVLKGQLKVAMSLEKLLRKRPPHEALGSAGSVPKRMAVFDPDQDAAIFDALGARLDELYEQLDATWLETGLVVNQHEVNEAEPKLDAVDNIYLEIVSSKIVPFSAKRVSDAAWQLMSGGIQVTNGHISTIERTEDVIKTRFYLTLRLRRSEAPIQVNMAVKRFIEDSGRIVFVWSSDGHIEGSSIGHQRVKISENGWAVIEKHRMTSPSLGLDDCEDESCIMQMCMRMVPGFSGMPQQNAHVGLLSEMIIGSYTTNIRCLVQHIENMLLSGAFR